MYDPELTAAVYAVAFLLFITAMFVGAVSTIARVVYYRVNNVERPRLLTRDVLVMGGLTLAFGQIALIRFLGPDYRAAVVDNVLWALSTSIPAVAAVLVYAYYELFVIERGGR